MLGIAPAERLSGLVRHLVARNASAAIAELDATIQNGVEVGLLLDQLVGYFRDVMTTAAGCPADQMLYALPSQGGEVAQVAGQLGLSTVLAIGQILDHTAARLRVSMHARTLVEMALVRICQLGDLDDLAALVAELRGTPREHPEKAARAETRTGSTLATSRPQPNTAAKKNAELQPTTLASAAAEQSVRREDAAHVADVPTPGTNGSAEDAPMNESVLAQYQRAMAGGAGKKPVSAPPRVSRREQLAQIAEQPFVRRAMELFDAGPGQLRYTPPEGEPN